MSRVGLARPRPRMTGPRIAAQQRVGASALSGALVVGGGAAAVSAESMWSGARIIGHRVVGGAGSARGEQAFTWTIGSLGDRFPQVQLQLAGGRLTRPQALIRAHAIEPTRGAVGVRRRGAATVLWSESETRTGESVHLMASVRPPRRALRPRQECRNARKRALFGEVRQWWWKCSRWAVVSRQGK